MGIDTRILIRPHGTTAALTEQYLADYVLPAWNDDLRARMEHEAPHPDDPDHNWWGYHPHETGLIELWCGYRYFADGYERGHWPTIYAYLIHAGKYGEVYYYPDTTHHPTEPDLYLAWYDAWRMTPDRARDLWGVWAGTQW